MERYGPSAVRGLEAAFPRGLRPWEAAGAGLTMVRNQEWQCGAIGEARRSREDTRASAVEAPRRERDFIRRAGWQRERFPEVRRHDAEGLVKLVGLGGVKAHDWSLTPDRYVSVVPDDADEDLDFEEALRAIHIDSRELTEAAAEFAIRVSWNFEGLGA